MAESQEYLNALPAGFRFEQYEFNVVLGAGGFGMTYRGYDHKFERTVAIKEYLPSGLAVRQHRVDVLPKSTSDLGDFEWGLDSFVDEAKLLARFKHPNIVNVYDRFEANGTAYIVMEYVRGETLLRVLQRKGRLSQEELKALLFPLLDGIEQVHAAQFLHRDIKPDNIICGQDESPVIVDFGAARLATSAKTLPVTVIIAPGYSPIEQYSSNGKQGPWTDIYALGAVAYRAITGEKPPASTERVAGDGSDLDLLPANRDGWNDHFLASVNKALAVHGKDRPQSVAEWRTELLGREEPAARALGPASELKRRQDPIRPSLYARAAVLIGSRLRRLERPPARVLWFGGAIATIAAMAVTWMLTASDPNAQDASSPPLADATNEVQDPTDDPPVDAGVERAEALKKQMVTHFGALLEQDQLPLAEGLLEVAEASWPNESTFQVGGELRQALREAIARKDEREISKVLDLAQSWRSTSPTERAAVADVLEQVEALVERHPANSAARGAARVLHDAFKDSIRKALEDDPQEAERLLAETPGQWATDAEILALSEEVRLAAQRQTISRLLADGEESLNRDRLTQPTEDNAVRQFTAVLRMDSNNEAALAGMGRVEARLAGLTWAAIAGHDFGIARRRLASLVRVNSSHADIPALESAINPPETTAQTPETVATPDSSLAKVAERVEEAFFDEEDRLWHSVKDSCREGDLDLYCDAYPDGRYKDQCAEQRLACLILRAQPQE